MIGLEEEGKSALWSALRTIVPPKLKVTNVRQDKARGHVIHFAAYLVQPDNLFAILLLDKLTKPR